ncbi:class I SAM-dependent methyltransferase [Streptomyces sp. NPDC021093]|uniref:class I SAM-dependent methyltransferase n=1 Tax=Streptomyces sp. NPDC021093 TaxID=3365112 RepID=UPI00378C112F
MTTQEATQAATQEATQPTPWYAEFFGANDLYTDSDIEYQDPGLTREMVDCVTALVPPDSHPRLLDLACGTGRHSVPLAAAGYRVTGVDQSPHYLAQAARRADHAHSTGAVFTRADMRDLSAFADGGFDTVVNLHTSFGFFATEEEELQVLREVRRVLAPGGRFVIDVINRDAFLRQTSEVFGAHPRDRFVIRTYDDSTGRTFLHEEIFDPLTSRISWTVTEPAAPGAPVRTSTADYRVFSAHELTGLLRRAGFTCEAVYGDYARTPFTIHAPSIVVVATTA